MSDTFSNKETETYWFVINADKTWVKEYRDLIKEMNFRDFLNKMESDLDKHFDNVEFEESYCQELFRLLLADALYDINFVEIYNKLLEVTKSE